jgi:hypothetical protein
MVDTKPYRETLFISLPLYVVRVIAGKEALITYHLVKGVGGEEKELVHC